MTEFVDSSTPVVSVECQTTAEQDQLYTFELFRNNDKSLHFHTGLENFNRFLFVFHSLGPAVYELNYLYGPIHKPCVEDRFLLGLMKLRQKKTNFELREMFGLQEKQVYSIFVTWIQFMAL